jgi:hypothetical protein
MGDESTGSIKRVAIFELLNNNYFIRSYQRGYRWSEQQVAALLCAIGLEIFVKNLKKYLHNQKVK